MVSEKPDDTSTWRSRRLLHSTVIDPGKGLREGYDYLWKR